MRSYEEKLQKELIEVIHKNHPITGFELGVQLKYMHAIGSASVSRRNDELEDELLEKVQLYRYIEQHELGR